MKKITLVIRSRNDRKLAERAMEAIFAQKTKPFEILNFDNASTDGTAELIASYPNVKSFNVPEDEYVPGKVLNAAVKVGTGDIFVFNNSDSVPIGDDWLENISRPLVDGTADAVYAKQCARADADLWVKLDYARAFPDYDDGRIFFSMASSAATAKVLKKFPFDESYMFSEDTQWSIRLRENGAKVAYCPQAKAEHSHNYTYASLAKRFAGEGVADAKIYGTRASVFSWVKAITGAVLRDFFFLLCNGGIGSFPRAIKIRFIQKTSYFKARNNFFKNSK